MKFKPLKKIINFFKSKMSISTKKTSLLSLKGTNKGSGLYKDAKESDVFIAKLRDEWD